MRQVFSALLAFWTIGLLVVAIIFFATIHWDHRFGGQPPYAIWTGTAMYLGMGYLLFKGAWRNPNRPV